MSAGNYTVANNSSNASDAIIRAGNSAIGLSASSIKRKEDQRIFALNQNRLDRSELESSRRFGLQEDRAKAAVIKEQKRFDANAASNLAAVNTINSVVDHKFELADHPESIKKEVKRLRTNWASERSANTAYLSSDGNTDSLDKAMKIYESGLDLKNLGKTKVADKVARRRLRLEALTLDLKGTTPEERAFRIKSSQEELYSAKETALQSRINSGESLTPRQRMQSIFRNSKGITNSKDLLNAQQSVLATVGGSTAESLLARNVKRIDSENSAINKSYNSQIAGVNAYNKSKGKEGNKGYGDVLEALKDGEYGSWDKSKVNAAIKQMTDSGVDLESMALAIYMGTTGTGGVIFDKGFANVGSDEWNTLVTTAKKMSDSKSGGAFKTVGKRAELQQYSSLGDIQARDFSRGSVNTTYLKASDASMRSILDWRSKTKALLDQKKKEVNTEGATIDENLSRSLLNIPEEGRSEVEAIILKNRAAEIKRREDVKKADIEFDKTNTLTTDIFGNPVIKKKRKVNLERVLNTKRNAYQNLSGSSTDPVAISNSLAAYKKARANYAASRKLLSIPMVPAAPRKGLIRPLNAEEVRDRLISQKERSKGRGRPRVRVL